MRNFHFGIDHDIHFILFIFFAIGLLFSGCSSDPVSDSNDDIPPGPPATVSRVPPDGQLEAVTWNIEWFGSGSNGPDDESLQTDNVIEVMDSLDADLYALQEIVSRNALNSLTDRMTGYSGFVANHIGQDQKMAFIYNTETVDSLDSGAIEQGQESFDWAGRLPLFFSFNYRYENISIPVFAIVIHAKASADMGSYQRRVRAADSLHAFLKEQYPGSNILLLGDFNDDVDVTIYDDNSPSPYDVFVSDTLNYKVITSSISNEGRSSFLGFPTDDLIDHIVISNELFDKYKDSSEEIYFAAQTFIDNYSGTTSDHLPVWTVIDFRN